MRSTFTLSRAEVRELDRRAIEEFGIPGAVLMENAGRGVAELLLSLNIDRRPVVIICGKGNNGGDGFVIARHLDFAGVNVRIIDHSGSPTGDALLYRDIAIKCGIPFVDSWEGEVWIVDALFGTGLTRAIDEPFASVVRQMNASGSPILAVDVPSGMDCDTGRPLGECVRATHTATFVAPKLGFHEPCASEYLGKLHVLGIGAPRVLIESFARGTTWTV